MDLETKYTDLTFFTNDSEDTILDRFKVVLKTVEFFDILAAIKRNLPEQFFKHTAPAKDVSMSIPK